MLKIIATCMSILLTIGIIPVSGIDGTESSNSNNELHCRVYEYDAAAAKKNEGTDIEAIEGRLKELKALPEQQPENMGFAKSQAEIVKEYDGSGIENNPQLRAAMGALDITITAPSASSSSITAKLSWNWSSPPIFYAADDVAACSRQGYNTASQPIGVLFNATSSAYINYYDVTYGTQHIRTVAGQFVGSSYDPFGHVELPASRVDSNAAGYAKKGDILIRVSVPQNTSASIGNVTMRLAYGYVVEPSLKYSVSFPRSLEILFGESTTAVFDRTVGITSGGSVTGILQSIFDFCFGYIGRWDILPDFSDFNCI